jgi:hypothetical protein
VRLREGEILGAAGVRSDALPVGLVGRETVEGDQSVRDSIGALVRHPIADEIAAAARNNGQPTARILFKLVALEGIELVTDEDGDRHGGLC